MQVGFVFGESSISEFSFIVNPENIPKFGDYVVTENRDGEIVLGIVRSVRNFNRLIFENPFSFEYAMKNLVLSRNLLEKNDVVIATAKVVGVVKESKVSPNRTPIKPNSVVKLADSETISQIFSNSGIEIGCLIARNDVKVSLDVKQLVLRHFAILSVTGGGKSNAVAVLVDGIVRKFGGTVVLIDPHGEYVDFTFEDGSERKKNIVPIGIRPEKLEPWEFSSLVGVDKNASVQRMHLERIFTTVKKEGERGVRFIERILELCEEWLNAASKRSEVEFYDLAGNRRAVLLTRDDVSPISRVKEYVSMFLRRYEELLTQHDMLANLKLGYLNVLNLSGFDVEQMRVVVSYLLRNILNGRISYVRGKNRDHWEKACPAIKKPMMLIFEEAHIFAPRDEEDIWMSRIAREGRKFGIGIGIISQRPKKINEDILSQCNTKIVLKIIEPNDQRYIQQASEQISEDILVDLSSLDVGEAIIVGPAINLPAAIKTKKFGGNYGGRDIDVVGEWKREEFKLGDIV